MSNTGTIHIALKISDKGVVRVMQDVGKASADTGRKGKQAFDDMDRSAKSFSSSAGLSAGALLKMGSGIVSISAIAAAMGKLSSESIKAASALEEVSSKFSVVYAGQTIAMTKVVKDLSENYAMSTREAKQYLAAMQDLLVPMGMQSSAAAKVSTEIVKLAADLGSFNNLPTQQVMENIQSALVGEYETMKKYGVVINAAKVEQTALNMKLADTKDALTAADKAQATYSLIVKSSTAAMGDMARTAEGYANTTKSLSAEWEDFTAVLGKKFLPMASSVKKALAEMFSGLNRALDPSIEDLMKQLAKIEEINKKRKGGTDPELTKQADFLRLKIENLRYSEKESAMFEKNILKGKELNEQIIQAEEDLANKKGKTKEQINAEEKALDGIKNQYAELSITTGKYADQEKRLADLKADEWYEAEAKALGGVTPKLKEVYELMLKKNQAKHEEKALEKAYQNVREAMSRNYADSMHAELDRFYANDLKDRAEVLKEAGKKSEKEIQEASEKSQKAYEKRMDEQKAASLDFADTVKDHTADIINNYDSMAETVVNIVKRMIADMAATILAQKILIPIGLQVGSALGASWNGVPFSAMQSNTAANVSPGSLLSSGNSLYNSFGIGDFLNSGTGGKIGSSVFGNAAWFGTPYFGAAEYMVPAAYGAAGSTAGGIAGALGTIAPIAAVAAIAIPLLMSAFKNEKDPLVAFHFGYDYPEKITKTLPVNEISEGGTYTDILQERPGSVTSDMGFFTYSQKMGPETNAAVKDYFEKQFAAIDTSLKINFEDVIKQKALESEAGLNPGEIGTGWNPEKYGGVEGALKEANNWVAKSLAAQFVQAYGLDASISPGLFEKLIPEGSDSMFDAFVRFGQLMESTDDAVAKFNRQLEITGNNAEQAFLNMESISGVFTSMDALLDPVTKLNDPLVTIIDQFNLWIDALEAANAGVEDITRAEQKRTQALGAQLSGLSAQNVGQSMLSAITTGTDIDAALNQIIGNSIAGTVSAALTKEVMDDAILPFVDSIGQAFMDSGNDIEAVFAILPALMAELDLSGSQGKIEAFTEKWTAMFGEVDKTSAMMTAAQPYLSALQSELSALENKMNDAKSVYLDLMHDELSVQEDLSSALSSSIKSLQSFRSTLWADNNASAGPADQRNMLSGRMDDLYSAALSGDAGAIEDFIAVSGQYLDVSKKMQTDWISYARDIAKTSSMLDGMESYAQDQLSEAQRQVLHLQGIIAEVTGVSNKLTDMDLARQAYESAKMEFDGSWMNDEIALLQGILTSSQTLASLMATFQKAQGVGGQTNSGATSAAIEAAYLAANPDVAAAVAAGEFASGKQHYEMWGQYESRGIEGYAGQSAEGKYLNAYPDVAAAVRRGEFASGMSHYLQYGINENRQFADGGILSGPKSGYPVNATFHGIEAVIPLNSGNIPVRIIDDSRGETAEEIRLLRKEMAAYGDAVVRHTSDIARLIDLWETFGPPAVRETV